MDNSNDRMYFDHLWKYFEIHANQRISLFRFYIAFFVFFITASGYLLIRFTFLGIFSEISAMALSLTFILITIIFQLLDNRNRQLIHYAEEGLENMEDQLFNNKDKCFKKEKEDKNSRIHHTTCFSIIYIFSYVFSFVLLLSSIIYLCCFGGSS